MISLKKKFNPEKLMSAMSIALFALLLANAYLDHKSEIDESIARLKTVLNEGKGEKENA